VRGDFLCCMKIELNKQLDKEMYISFRDAVVGGADFGEKIRKDHPQITEKNYGEYIDDYYQERRDKLEAVRTETENCFAEIREPLFLELKKYFGRDFSGRKYVCYLSIFDINARFLENKTFQVYYKRSYHLRKEVIAHELTHFTFYDFCHGLGIKDSQALWELSEIFNVIFLNLAPLQVVIGAEELLFYPNLKDKLETVKAIWSKQLPANEFVKTSLVSISSVS